jgi:hypothetical protein
MEPGEREGMTPADWAHRELAKAGFGRLEVAMFDTPERQRALLDVPWDLAVRRAMDPEEEGLPPTQRTVGASSTRSPKNWVPG